jgi:hypothetical protein
VKSQLTQNTSLILPHVLLLLFFCTENVQSQQRRAPAGGRVAVVVDERLSALRLTPDLSGKLLQRIGRGRLIAIRGQRRSVDGIIFYRVKVSRRTQGWIQKEAVVSPMNAADDQMLLRLIQAADDFDRLARARIFLDTFPNSRLRLKVLLLFGETAEAAAAKLSKDAARRLSAGTRDAPEFSYFLNYSGLDRYNRQGVRFVFDRTTRQFHYDGRAWLEIVRRYPFSAAATEARKLLETLRALIDK